MLILLALQAASVPAQGPSVPLRFSVLDPACAPVEGDTIVVCGARPDRFRLPLPAEREPLANAASVDRGSGTAALRPSGDCGIFAGQRRCRKAESLGYGYGGGRDPVTFAGRLLTKLTDPDAD
ncbi:hypothetical protein ASE75_03330 [Sphingomonas sp. Leaf17]|uniref:hypothetical protein n=1 Tax=Sphingomonas sp. Leaf17 TaxID=1735683 RepID=UPI000712BF13|nr:hypothetical protein [Sphingomonas sp. Leaf17]KQM67920.1 hypothetical protein ASE75_03330 [Sphingomonas sp. Leaf17]